jgi:hypothetical protein
MDEIVNKVKNSSLVQLDLADYKPSVDVVDFDLKGVLWQEMILKEKEFRAFITDFDWQQFSGKVVAIGCSVDAIIPTWAYMLVSAECTKRNIQNYTLSKEEIIKTQIVNKIKAINTHEFRDAKVIIKGCSDIADPAFAMTELIKHLQPHVSSIMYGEPCSTVPVYKRPKS